MGQSNKWSSSSSDLSEQPVDSEISRSLCFMSSGFSLLRPQRSWECFAFKKCKPLGTCNLLDSLFQTCILTKRLTFSWASLPLNPRRRRSFPHGCGHHSNWLRSRSAEAAVILFWGSKHLETFPKDKKKVRDGNASLDSSLMEKSYAGLSESKSSRPVPGLWAASVNVGQWPRQSLNAIITCRSRVPRSIWIDIRFIDESLFKTSCYSLTWRRPPGTNRLSPVARVASFLHQ